MAIARSSDTTEVDVVDVIAVGGAVCALALAAHNISNQIYRVRIHRRLSRLA
jgi:hypothetical protein